jgi:CheY-like chemotaxis protein
MAKILIIEDNKEVRENTEEILELAGHDVSTAENGKVGVQVAKAELPDLIICDIMMPMLDGYGVLHILSTDPHTSRIPFIFLSAKANPQDVRKGMGLGADDYLTKPFEESDLLRTIEIRLKKNDSLKELFDNADRGLDTFLENAGIIEELEANNIALQRKSFEPKQMIYRQDDPAYFIYMIESGKVKTYRSTQEAKELITRINGPGDFIGHADVLQGEEYSEFAEAMEKVSMQRIDRADFLSLVEKNRIVAASLIKLLASDKLDQEKRLLDMAYHSVRIRLRNTLLSLEEKATPVAQGYAIHMSREELSSILGTSTETVIRTLSEFKKEGLLTLDKNEVCVTDKARLEDMRF